LPPVEKKIGLLMSALKRMVLLIVYLCRFLDRGFMNLIVIYSSVGQADTSPTEVLCEVLLTVAAC
jgi:hypothetical protein